MCTSSENGNYWFFCAKPSICNVTEWQNGAIQLHTIIRKCVNEAINKKTRDIYSIEVYNETREVEYYDAEALVNYYDIDEAFQTAKELANKYKEDEDVIAVIVFAGQYEVPSGDVYGDAEAIEVIRNK